MRIKVIVTMGGLLSSFQGQNTYNGKTGLDEKILVVWLQKENKRRQSMVCSKSNRRRRRHRRSGGGRRYLGNINKGHGAAQ